MTGEGQAENLPGGETKGSSDSKAKAVCSLFTSMLPVYVSAKTTGVRFIPRRNGGPKEMPPTIAPGTTWWHQYPKMIEHILLLILHWKP